MRKKWVISILFVLLILSPALFGTEYYVNGASGNDGNSGLSVQSAWRTIEKANNTLQEGDTVFIRSGTYTDRIDPDHPGSRNNYITYAAYQGDTPVIRTSSTSASINEPYIRLLNLTFDGGGSQANSNVYTFISVNSGGDRVWIEGCTIAYTTSNVTFNSPGAGIQFNSGASHGRVRNCVIHHIGRKEIGDDYDLGEGIQCKEGSSHIVIEGCEVYAIGHTPVQTYGDFIVVQNCDLHNENWNKCGSMAGINDNHVHYNVWQNNDIHHSAERESGMWPNNGMQHHQNQGIFRQNRVYKNFGHGLAVNCAGNQYPKNAKIYNNVFYDNGHASPDYGFGYAIRIKENPSQPGFTGMGIKNNIFYGNRYDGIAYSNYASPSDHIEANNHKHSNGNPRFTNAEDADFTLRSDSPCRDAGAWLTQTASGGSGTWISVQDAAYFCDGYGMTPGDEIQLEGQSQRASIVDVDYGNDRIQVDRSMTWQSGQGVALAYDGSAPDIGAHEFEDGGGGGGEVVPLDADADASPHSGNAPLTVQFTGSADGGTTPYSYSWTFGDGSSSTAQSPSHTYTQAGTFTARLTVTDGDSNQNSTTETITVSSSTSSISAGIVASPTSGTVPLTVNFTGTADGGVSPYTYTWNFGDGDTGSGRIPSHTYNEAGSFQVVLTVRDSQNDQDTAYVTITGSAAVGNAQLLLSSSTGAPAPDSGGTISPQNGTHTYPIGTTVNITANPKPNYRFSRWAGSITEQKAGKHEINITLMGNRSLTAIFCSTCGDVNGDMNISPLDCQGIFDIFLGRNDSPTLCQKENADVNTDGSFITPNITPADAQAVFKQYLGKNSLPGDCSCTERMSTSLMGNPLIPMAEARRENHIFLEHDFIGAGNEIAVTIAVDNPAGIDAFGFDLVYPSDCLEFAGVVKSPLLEKFYQVDGNPKEADVIRIGGYGSDPIDDAFTNEFVVVIFKVKGFSENPIDFYIANTFDDLSLATIYTQTAMYTLNETTKEKDTNREYVRK